MIKIGYSNDPIRRCEDLNSAIPPAAVFKWRLELKSKSYPDGAAALIAEDQLKKILVNCSDSMGKEFFLGEKDKIDNAFTSVPSVGFKIQGAYRKT